MAIFYGVVEGDPLDSVEGSYVSTSSRCCNIQGTDGKYRQLVFIGDDAWCNACKSTGVIVRGASLPDSMRFLDLTSGAGARP
ncbi:hypothetical protein SAMN05216466_12868 [Paraburkholderia phenazinium]|uniref:PAAR motif-containing protein n=1 Tax=Paraburkholderia phenazinium TaxID=60549 RepID=A0A1G8M6L8_9BURK|nr:hypothetical protein SAMN05216466_12868 [Paraburkholderia phenazinium]